MTIHAGYCQLCRRQELNDYGEMVGSVTKDGAPDERHILACEAAGCLHPSYYRFSEENGEKVVETLDG